MARKCHRWEATKDEGLVTSEEISAFKKSESKYERRSLRMENYLKAMLVTLADAGVGPRQACAG